MKILGNKTIWFYRKISHHIEYILCFSFVVVAVAGGSMVALFCCFC